MLASLFTVIFITRTALIIKNMVNDTTSALWWFDPVRVRSTLSSRRCAGAADCVAGRCQLRFRARQTYYILLEMLPVTIMLYMFSTASGASRTWGGHGRVRRLCQVGPKGAPNARRTRVGQ